MKHNSYFARVIFCWSVWFLFFPLFQSIIFIHEILSLGWKCDSWRIWIWNVFYVVLFQSFTVWLWDIQMSYNGWQWPWFIGGSTYFDTQWVTRAFNNNFITNARFFMWTFMLNMFWYLLLYYAKLIGFSCILMPLLIPSHLASQKH